MQMIKEYYEKYNVPPSFDALDQIARIEVTSEIARKNIFDMLNDIKECPYEDHLWIQEKSLKFCKQQELKKAITKVNKILDDVLVSIPSPVNLKLHRNVKEEG